MLHGTSINFRYTFGIVAPCKSICFFMAENLPNSKEKPRLKANMEEAHKLI